jgi:hypothetical protein
MFDYKYFYEQGGFIHAATRQHAVSNIFLMWTACEKDVEANHGFSSDDAKVNCPECIEVLNENVK